MNKIKNSISIIALASLTLLANGCITDSTSAVVGTSSINGSSSSKGASSSSVNAKQDSAANALAAAYIPYLGKTIVGLDFGLLDTQVTIFQPITKTWVPIDSVCSNVSYVRPDTINPALFHLIDSMVNLNIEFHTVPDTTSYLNMGFYQTQVTVCQLNGTDNYLTFPGTITHTNHMYTENNLAVVTNNSINHTDSSTVASYITPLRYAESQTAGKYDTVPMFINQ